MSYDYWISLHQHTAYSNSAFFEVVTKPEDYIQYAKDRDQPAVCITEHGGVFGWLKKKGLIEAAGLKYVHGMEGYVCDSPDDKARNHIILVALNYDGVKEINRLSSKSFNRNDGHYYYRPRIFLHELKEVVEHHNIIVTTACLAGPIAANLPSDGDELEITTHKRAVLDEWIALAKDNPDYIYLEVQPHNIEEQKKLNKVLVHYADQYGLKLIAANDIHALNPTHDKLRKIIQKGKGSKYEDEGLELWCKDRNEMIKSFKLQGVLTDAQINNALDLTVDVVHRVQDFQVDDSHKYPHLYDDPEREFQKRIKQGLHDRGIDKLPSEEQKKYAARINHEYKVYKHNGAIDYMLSHEDIVNAAKEHGAHFGFGRGSASGSVIAYLCGQTEMDSLKLGLNFERFMNPERVSLADIDEDLWSPDQQWIQKWMLTNPRWHAASIMTANTYGLKGAVKALARGMEKYKDQPAYVQSICNQIEDEYLPTDLYEKHQQLFDYAKQVIGTIDSFGRHAAGIVMNTDTIDDTMGTMTIAGWDYPVSQIEMKQIERFSWVKFDMLGLDNVGLISKAAELAGIPFPTPNSDFIDFEDEKVWNSMREDNIGVFQMEGDRAGKLLRDMLSPQTMTNIRSNEAGKNVKYMDLLSLVNAAQRPSGASYVDAVTHGKFKDNGHPALNEFLAPTLGELVYQEQLIQFLVQFCGRTPGQADVLRRAVGHKIQSVIDEEVPQIHRDFVKTMVEKYHDTPQHAEQIAQDFMQVFMDAANYGFSINHSMAYSYIGYISTWLRYHYPLEWCTAAFQIWKGKQEKINKVTKFAERHGITMKPVQFRKSKGLYYMDKTTNTIYEGTATIKGCNQQTGDELYVLRDGKYQFFTDLLIDIFDNNIIEYTGKTTSVLNAYKTLGESFLKGVDLSTNKHMEGPTITPQKGVDVNSRAMINLIRLGYFKEFGGAKKLVQIYDFYRKNYNPRNKRLVGKYKKYKMCLEFEQSLEDANYPISVSLQDELSLLGRCASVNSEAPANLAFVTNVIKRSNKTRVGLYSLKRGQEVSAFIRNSDLLNSKLKAGNVLRIKDTYLKPKLIKTDGHWVKSQRNQELWVKDFSVIR